MPRQLEGKLVQKIKAEISGRGGRSFKIVGNDEGFQEVGIPDLLIVYLGIFIGMEVKQPGADLRPRQRLVLREIFDAGGVAAVVETVGQAARLLSYLEERSEIEATCFDRGTIYHDRCRFS